MLAETGSIPKEPDPWQDRIMDESLARNNYPKEKLTLFKQHAIEIGHCSLMAKHMSPDIFERYRLLTSSGNGNWTISRAINTGIMFPSAYMGIHAGDPESYDTFVDIFKPCIEDYHTGFSWDSGRPQQTDLNADNLSMELTPDAKSRIISSRIRVARNLGGDFVMNPNGSAQSRIDVLHTVQKAVEEIDEDLRGKVHVHSTMSAAEEQALIDDHFLFKGQYLSFI
jgi:ATP:guanido phosphotransferase, N-terminal domain